jgi:quercetin dioxygenase-like cupin family protein
MKYLQILSTLLILANLIVSCNSSQSGPTETQLVADSSEKSVWPWADSLEALVAAPDNHKLIFETEEYRILHVTIIPGILDPIHTHKDKSVIWVTKISPIIYKTYGLGNNKEFTLVKEDTIYLKPEELNKGFWENPEPPHSVENIGKDTFELYRIEYKTKN